MTDIGSWIGQIIGLVIVVALAIVAVSVVWAVTLDYIDRRSRAARNEEIIASLAAVYRWFSGFRDLDIIWDYIYGKRGGSIDLLRSDYAKLRNTDVYGKSLKDDQDQI